MDLEESGWPCLRVMVRKEVKIAGPETHTHWGIRVRKERVHCAGFRDTNTFDYRDMRNDSSSIVSYHVYHIIF